MNDIRKCTISMMPQGLKTEVPFGTEIHHALSSMIAESGLDSGYSSPCGGRGTCGKCRIRIVSGEVSPLGLHEEQLLSEDDIISGIRLACYARAEGNVVVSEVTSHREMAVETDFEISDASFYDGRFVESYLITCEVPTIEDNLDITERVLQALEGEHGVSCGDISLDVLHQLSVVNNHLTDLKEPVSIWVHVCDGKVCGIAPAPGIEEFYGIAVDIGTTTVACYLVSLKSGEIINITSDLNAQHIAGADVVSRIGYTSTRNKGSEELSDVIRNQIEGMILDLCTENQIMPEQITSCAIAGNTTMMHLLIGVDPKSISRYPFNPVFTSALVRSDLFTEIERCPVYLMPSASSYIGADIVGGAVAVHLDETEETALFVDIGTNGEIVLKTGEGIYACSTAAGPAFEGANLACGSGGVSGVIDSVLYDGEAFSYTTIHEQEAIAICGSGVLDVTAMLLEEGLIDHKGSFFESDHPLMDRVVEIQGKKAFSLSGETVYLNQADIREIQLAKSAIRTGIDTLITESGIDVEDIDRLYIAGGFGSRIRISSAAAIGLIPPQLSDKVICVGNTSGKGAVSALLDRDFRKRCSELRMNMNIIDLSGRKSFTKDLMRNMYFMKMNDRAKEVAG